MLIATTYRDLIITNVGFNGLQFPTFANGLALGFTNYLLSHPSNVIYSVGDVGAPGTGAGIGFPISCSPTILNNLFNTNMAGMMGMSMPQFLSGLANATCIYLGQAQSVTIHAGVGAGTGIGGFIGVEPIGLKQSIIASTGFSGMFWPDIVEALSRSLTEFLLTSVKFSIVITGPAGPGAATGTGSGRII
jgi:hypothetical protein